VVHPTKEENPNSNWERKNPQRVHKGSPHKNLLNHSGQCRCEEAEHRDGQRGGMRRGREFSVSARVIRTKKMRKTRRKTPVSGEHFIRAKLLSVTEISTKHVDGGKSGKENRGGRQQRHQWRVELIAITVE